MEDVKKSHNVANNVAQRNSQDLTEQWKKGELVQEDYYLKDNKYTFIDYFNGVSFEETCDFEIKEVLAEVPSYEEWQPFTDPYFRGLTTKDIAELAKKSIRLTTQHCEDNHKIEDLKELLAECREIVDENLEFSKSIGRNRILPRNEGLLTRIDEALNG